MGINEIIVNGETLMSTRNDTVSENNLLQGETATNRAGEHVEGELDPAMKNEAYLVSDDVGEISEDDYIPFNDVSDEEQPKKKTVFSSIISKIKGLFVEKKPSNAQHEFIQGSLDLTMKAKNIDASMSDNNVSAINYLTTGNFVDNQGRIMMREEATINPDGKIGWKAYVRNYDTQGNNVGQKGMQFRMNKTGGLEYIVGDPNAFRSAINTVDQLGVAIPDNTDLDTYKTAGTYRITSDTSAGTMSNLPLALCGKLVVLDNGNGGYEQFYFSNHSPRLFRRTFWDNAWSNWTESSSSNVTPSMIGGGYAVASISGTSITATIDGFQLKTGGIVSLKCGFRIPADATLNISNTGAKIIKWYDDNSVRASELLYGDQYTFIYDGTYYRIISYGKTPRISTASYVADASGSIVGNFFCDQNAFQLKYNLGDDKLRWNFYKNSAWSGDIKIADYNDLITQKGISIPSNADLNTYRTNGVYYIGTQAIADTVLNIPIALSGKLIVMGTTTDGGWNYQFYIPNHQLKVYVRREGDGSTNTWTDWKQFLTEQTEGVLHLYRETTTADDLPININFSIKDTTTGKTFSRNVIRVYQDHQSDPWGFNTFIDGGGNLFLSGGESGEVLYPLLSSSFKEGENLLLLADNNIYAEVNCQTIADRLGVVLNSGGQIIPIKAEAYVDNFGSLGVSGYRFADIWTYKINGSPFDLGSTIAKSGKNLISAWGRTTNVYENNGITYTFNPQTGEITANGTATADSNCILMGNGVASMYEIPKGTYILSGCPSGGGDNKYCIRIQLTEYGGVAFSKQDSGSGNTFTLTKDCKCDFTHNQNCYIFVKSGQTVSNLVFKPMLRPAFASDTYIPSEDIFKGNCYVGTCTTAGGTKDKVAYVDGYFVLRKGVRVAIKFSNTNTYSNVTSSPITLNVNNTGAKNIYYWNTHSGSGNTGEQPWIYGTSNRYNYYMYDGTYWVYDGYSGDNYQDVIYKVYSGTNSMKNYGVQDLEEITLSAGVYMITWREQVQSTSLVGIAFGFSSTKKTSGTNFSAETGYYGCFSRTGVLEDHCCSLPVRVTASTKFYAQHFVGGSTALTSALGRLEITRIK